MKLIKTIKSKYVIGSLMSGFITVQTFSNLEKYNIAVTIIFAIIFLLSLVLACIDRYTHAVTNDLGSVIAKFDNEKDAMEFANEQAQHVKVLMLHIQ